MTVSFLSPLIDCFYFVGFFIGVRLETAMHLLKFVLFQSCYGIKSKYLFKPFVITHIMLARMTKKKDDGAVYKEMLEAKLKIELEIKEQS
jgi:hypothetical protein